MRIILCLLFALLIACGHGNEIVSDEVKEQTLAKKRAECLEICYERYDEREMFAMCRAMYQSDMIYDTGMYILCVRDYNVDLKMCRLSCVLSQIGEWEVDVNVNVKKWKQKENLKEKPVYNIFCSIFYN